jgi:hypothetical protein
MPFKGGAFDLVLKFFISGFSRFFLVPVFRQTLIRPVNHIFANRHSVFPGNLFGEGDHAGGWPTFPSFPLAVADDCIMQPRSVNADCLAWLLRWGPHPFAKLRKGELFGVMPQNSRAKLLQPS